MGKEVFISHSSQDVEFVVKFNDFLKEIGVSENNIFCSSIPGQDVKNGERIEEVVRTKLMNADLTIFVISKNFVSSPFCTNELGAGWILQESKKSKMFILKMPDVSFDEIKGFVDSKYKFSELNNASLCGLIDDVIEFLGLPPLKATKINDIVAKLISETSGFVKNAVKNKDLSEEEQMQIARENLYKTVKRLNIAEKKAIADLYFEEDRILSFDTMNGLINVLRTKGYVFRCSSVSYSYSFPYSLQPWVIDYIDEHDEFKKELEKLHQKNRKYDDDYF